MKFKTIALCGVFRHPPPAMPLPQSLFKGSTLDPPGVLSSPRLFSSIILCLDLNKLLAIPLHDDNIRMDNKQSLN